MKHLKQLAAGITGAAILLQNAGGIPLLPAAPALTAPVLTASAASVQANNPVTFVYDFHGFQVQYMPNKDRWFNMDGTSVYSETEAVQVITAEDDSSLKLILNFEEQTASVSKDGTETDCSKLFRELLFEPLANIRPEYETGPFFDKASQRYIERPEPLHFPLTFTCAAQFRNSAPAGLTCSIRFGQYEYGTLGISMQGDMFSDAAGGSVQIRTAAGLQAQAVIAAGTYAGDVNYDRKVDVSDAVLACRIAVEDLTARVRDIGMALADTNCDDHVDGSDINDIIYDIALIPYEDRVPAGTVPVISAEKLGVSDFVRVFGEDAKKQYGNLVSCEEGEKYDKWYFAVSHPGFIGEETRSYQFNLTSMALNDRGILDIVIESSDKSKRYSGLAMIAVTVPHGKLPADTVGSFDFAAVPVLPPYAPLIRYIPVKKAPENAITEFSAEQPAPQRTAADLAKLAQTLGYSGVSGMEESVRAEYAPCVTRQHCTAGEKYDVWDMGCFLFDPTADPQPAAVVIEELELDLEDHILFCRLGMYVRDEWGESDYTDDEYQWFWVRLTVPHGTVPADFTALISPELRRKPTKSPGAKYISVYDPPAEWTNPGIYCWDQSYSGLRDIANAVPDAVRAELDEPDAAYAWRIYTDPEQMPETEQNVWRQYMESVDPILLYQIDGGQADDFLRHDLLYVYFKTPAEYYSEYGIESAECKDGVLTLKAAEYRPAAQAGLPAHYDRLLVIVPKNGLKTVTDVRLEMKQYYDGTEQLSSAEEPECDAVLGADGLWHWEQEVHKRESFLRATGEGAFYITGEIPDETYRISGKVNISVVDYETGEPLPGYELKVRREGVYIDPDTEEVYLADAWTTTENEPVRTLTLSAVRFNYGYHDEQPDYKVSITGFPQDDIPRKLPKSEQMFRIPDDGSTLNIVLYALRNNIQQNVYFKFRDWSKSPNTSDFISQVAANSELTVCDFKGNEMYYTIPWESASCALPDGTYIAKLTLRDCDYTFADPANLALKGIYTGEELRQISDPEGIIFTVKNGVPDAPEYCFDLMLKEPET